MIAYKYKTYSRTLHCIAWLVEVWNASELIKTVEKSTEQEADQFINSIYA